MLPVYSLKLIVWPNALLPQGEGCTLPCHAHIMNTFFTIGDYNSHVCVTNNVFLQVHLEFWTKYPFMGTNVICALGRSVSSLPNFFLFSNDS
jgi:hypothetical protein